MLEGGDGRDARRGELGEALGAALDRVAVRHPAGLLGGQAGKEATERTEVELGAAELADLGALDEAAERVREELHAVADAEHGDAELEQAAIERGRPGCVDRRRPA